MHNFVSQKTKMLKRQKLHWEFVDCSLQFIIDYYKTYIEVSIYLP